MKPFLLAVFLCIFAVSAVHGEKNYEIIPDVVFGHKAGMALTYDVIRPLEQNGAAVLFMMSGGWVSGWLPPESFMTVKAPFGNEYFRKLVDKGYTVVIVRHGSSPQFKVPEAVADVRRAVRFIKLNSEKYGIDPDRIGVCGGSAGGHLSLMLGTTGDEGTTDGADAIERGPSKVAAVVAYFPPVDLREWVGPMNRFPALEFDAELAESVSPLLQVTPDDAPTLLIHGDKDTLVKLDNSERILKKFEEEQVPAEMIVIEGAGHGFPGEQGTRAGNALIEWFDKYLAKETVQAGGNGE